MIRLLPYCPPVLRRLRPRVRRHVARGTGVATVAKVAAVAVVAGPVCFMLPMWGGGAPDPHTLSPVVGELYSAPILPAGSVFGGLGNGAFGGYGSPLDSRDYAALIPAPGVSLIPIGGPLVVLPGNPEAVQQPTPVSEPWSIAIFAAAVVLLAVVRNCRHG